QSDKQPARFIAKKCGIEKRLGGEPAENAKRAPSQKFLHKAQDEHIPNRQGNEQRPAKTGELAHFHRAEKPKAPDKIDSQQDDADKKGTREVPSQALHQRRPEQPRQSDQKKKRTGDVSGGLQRQMINHAAIIAAGALGWLNGAPYRLNPLARSICTSTSSPTSSSPPSKMTILF